MNQRVLFMGTPAFAVPTLRAVCDAGWPIVGVVCQPDKPVGRGQKLTPPPVKALALERGLSVHQPARIRNNPEFMGLLRELAPDLILVVAYGKLLPKEVLDLPRYGCLNVHASLLPRYRGAAPIQWAIIRGEAVTGVTLMKMDIGMDTGDMLARADLPIDPADTTATLSPRLAELGARLAVAEIPRWIAGELRPQRQDDEAATMAPMLAKETGVIDWSQPARAIADLVRGVQPWPGAATTLAGQPLKIQVAGVLDEPTDAAPGTILALTTEGWKVATGKGTLLLREVQAPGKPARPAADVARGWREVSPGVRLGELAGVAGA